MKEHTLSLYPNCNLWKIKSQCIKLTACGDNKPLKAEVIFMKKQALSVSDKSEREDRRDGETVTDP